MDAAYRNAIGTVESDNDYSALGPVTSSGDRAYGRYQVMGNNIPEWTERHLGRSMTPKEFLADTDAQDKVFDGETSAHFKKYGNLDDVTSTWFSGRPMAKAGNASDGYNTVPQYVSKVNAAYNAPDGPTAIDQAMGRRPSTGSKAMAYNGDDEDTPALKATQPMGALTAGGSPVVSNKWEALSRLGQTLADMAPGIAQDPDHAKALEAVAAGGRKVAGDQGTWSVHVMPNGQAMMVNSKGRMVPMPGNYAAEKEDPGVKARKEAEAKASTERFNTLQDDAATLDAKIAGLHQMRTAVQDPRVTFGGLGDTAASAKNLAYSLGMNVDGLEQTQAVQRLATKMQLAQGKSLPGAISNYEDQLMARANGVGLDKTRESNLDALAAQEAIYKHQKAYAQEATKYKQAHGMLDDGWYEHSGKWLSANQPQLGPATAAAPANTFKTSNGRSWSYN